MEFDDPAEGAARGGRGKIHGGHGKPVGDAAALDVLDRGGNAVDAAVAALLVLNVTSARPRASGVAPVLVYEAKTGR